MGSKTVNRRTAVLAIVVAAVIVTPIFYFLVLSPSPLEGVRVSIYADRGITASSRIALEHMFLWMGAEVSIIEPEDLTGGILNTTDMLVMPGGCWCEERCAILGEEMKSIIRSYIDGGGSYFGIDGGASYATNNRLNIFHGRLIADVLGATDFMTELDINCELTSPDLSQEPESYEVFYEASGYFETDDMTGIHTIATYANTSLPCMIAFKYGIGTVFLSSPHPEYEEDGNRDGTDMYDLQVDPDSEWDFMLRICQWLLDESG
ncbi:MAG: BPL-N domain-containing protein [Candidatus Thorarchaeota archaeon]|jgi:glutamine amidotransferase-like uncharacterized protein